MKKTTNINKSIEFSSLVFALGRKLREELRPSFEDKNGKNNICPFMDFAVLNYIKEKKNPFMKDISESLFISKPATSNIIDSMVSNKFIKRVADTDDRRAIKIELTKNGEKYLLEQKRKRIAILEKVFFALNSEERKQLMFLLEKVAFSDIKTNKK
jgi:DNA-binding MarR family transcriptional regulator